MPETLSSLDVLTWAPAAIGALCAALVFFAALGRRRRHAEEALDQAPAPRPGVFGPDPFVSGSPTDKRSTPRRRGVPVAVLLSDSGGRTEPVHGAVLDRSRGGLAIAAPAPAPTGTVLSVRAARYAREMAWVPVRVRHCRPDGDGWVLGCQFLSPQHWDVLLLFG